MTALPLKHKFETSKHTQLIGWFNKEFVAKDAIDKKYGQILRNAFQNRTKSDYDAFVEFTLSEAETILEEMKFIQSFLGNSSLVGCVYLCSEIIR